ncbi:MAG TPA: tRNA lysidine(34) synthetase TilS [Nitriliruptorales bacterium]|nr:tRNA lysidine(34) synthetase TilS [Nitriliruptorales bacterium]
MTSRTGPTGPIGPGLTGDELVAEVGRALTSLPRGAAAVVAVSGGPDSTVLAHLVAAARPDLRLTLAHVRHGLRDDRADVAAVRRLATVLRLPLEVTDVTVEPAGEGVEAAARHARYAALRAVAAAGGARTVLVGHTAEDQAETLLLRIARGTGVAGLAGMEPLRPHGRDLQVARPLLRLRRPDLRRFVARQGLDVVEDPTNRDPAVRRAVVRHEILPLLQRVGADPVAALARLADLAREDDRLLDRQAAVVAAALVRPYGPARAIPTDGLDALDVATARRVLRRLLDEVRPGRPPLAAGHVDAVLALRSGEAVDLPGAAVTRGGGWLAAVPRGLRPATAVPLQVPGVTPWRPAGVAIAAGPARPAPRRRRPAGDAATRSGTVPPGGDAALTAVLLSDDAAGGLTVRSRRPGDRLRTAAGTRKLQDLLVDAGVPRAVRDLLPMVVRGDRVLWVPGVAVDVDAGAAGAARPALALTVTR